LSLIAAFKPDAVYTGQQIIDFLVEAEAQYADKIGMIEAQRQVAQNDAVALRIEYGKTLRSAAALEQKLKETEDARVHAVETCGSLKAKLDALEELSIPSPPLESETLSLFPGDSVVGE